MIRKVCCSIVLVGAAAIVPAASGDSGSPNYRSKLTSVAPTIRGLSVRVVDGDDALELLNSTGRNVMVPGYEGEPYLRFLAGGRVEVNVNSAARYLNEERYGGVAIPKGVGPQATPRWQAVAQGGAYTWHDHRIHWMSTQQPPRVKESGGNTLMKVFDWNVPLKVGARRAKVSGTLWWLPSGQLDRADALIAAAVAKEARASKGAVATRPSTSTEPSTPPPDDQSGQAAVAATAPEPSSSTSVLWIVIAVLAVALLAAGAYVLRLRRRDPTAPKGEVW